MDELITKDHSLKLPEFIPLLFVWGEGGNMPYTSDVKTIHPGDELILVCYESGKQPDGQNFAKLRLETRGKL